MDFVISRFIAKALRNEDLIVYGDGSQTRTFCYIDDNLDAVEAIFNENRFSNEVVNIGNDTEISIKELAHKVVDRLNSRSGIIYTDPLKEGDMTRRRPDIEKMRSVLGRELITLDEGIMLTAKSDLIHI
jgi:UDP-glucose 4-epimerase